MSELNNILGNGKGRLPEEKLKAYLEGKLSAQEQYEVEKWLADEGMESDAIEGLQLLPITESSQIAKRINVNLQRALLKKPNRRTKAIKYNNWIWVTVIIILLLCMIGYIVLHYFLNNDSYTHLTLNNSIHCSNPHINT